MERQARINEIAAVGGLTSQAVPYFMLARGEGSEFDSNFNPALADQSTYHSALKKMMDCAERNAGCPVEKRDSVCAKEYKALRLAAFKDQLLYSHVNERFFVNENAAKNHETAL